MAVADFVRSARESFAVGWKIESNWTDPVLFATYRIVQPLASLLIVAFIVIIGSSTSGPGLPKDFLARLIVSNAFFVYVAQVMMTMGWLIHTDRSRYEVLKNIYISPGTLHPYLVGRGLVSVLNGTISVLVTLLFSVAIFNGLLNLNIPLDLLKVNLLMLAPAIVLGIASLLAIGYILCAVNIVSHRLEFILGESVSGIFFLLGGVIFPPTALPGWVQPISAVLPVTHFLEAIRDSFFSATLSEYLLDLGYLAATTLAVSIIGVLVFRAAEYRAKQLGLFDRKSEY
ncbi:MAG: ABC transporter permease [Thermoproteota archaeon]